MEPVIINSRRWSIFWRALFGVAFTAGCVYALRQGIKYTHIISLVLGILGIPAFGLLTVCWGAPRWSSTTAACGTTPP